MARILINSDLQKSDMKNPLVEKFMKEVFKTQSEFKKKFNERGYTTPQIARTFFEMNLGIYVGDDEGKKIFRYARKHRLLVDLGNEGIRQNKHSVRYLIKESDIERLIEVMNIPVSTREFMDRIY